MLSKFHFANINSKWFYFNIQPLLSSYNSDNDSSLQNIKSLLSCTSTPLSDSEILNACKGIKNDLAEFDSNIFDNCRQQDAHEAFLKICYFLDTKTKLELFTPSQQDDQSYTSVIKQLFFGILTTNEICSNCGHNETKTLVPFLNIFVEPSFDFNKNLTAEWNRKNDKKLCKFCHNNSKHLQTTNILTKPNILVILFQRFKQQRSGRISKLNTEINLVDDLKIPGFSGTLIGCIYHLGSTPNSGHYISSIKINNSWFSCNDNIIKPTTAPLNSESVYLAFYKTLD